MKNKMFVTVLMALFGAGLCGCGGDDGGGGGGSAGTGKKTVEEAAKKYCADYVLPCDPSGAYVTEDFCVAMVTTTYKDASERCSLASLDYLYCASSTYSGDICQFEEDDLTEEESRKIFKACGAHIEDMASLCDRSL